MNLIANRCWYQLGKYDILQKPLDHNPYWATHHVYLKGVLIGRCLSVPDESTCRWFEGNSVTPRGEQPLRSWNYGNRKSKAGPGRPRKHYTDEQIEALIT